MKAIYELPDDDAPMSAWMGGLSATLNTRPVTTPSLDPPKGDVQGLGIMMRRINKRLKRSGFGDRFGEKPHQCEPAGLD